MSKNKKSNLKKRLERWDFFDEKTLYNDPKENIESLKLSSKKKKTLMARQGLAILTSRATLIGTYFAVAFSLVMAVIYHHLSAVIPVVIALGLVETRLLMMKYFAENSTVKGKFGAKNHYATYGTIEVVANMFWLISMAIWGGVNLFGYSIAAIFCLISVASAFAQMIYFVKMNDIEINTK